MFPSLLFLLHIALVIGANVIWAILDARRERYRPIRRALTVAGIFMGFFFALAFWTFLRAPRPAGVTYDVEIAWAGVGMFLFFWFCVLSFIGWLTYCITHAFSYREPVTNPANISPENPTPVEETGNPYQPPST